MSAHNDQCGCAECYVTRQQTPPVPMGAEVQQEIWARPWGVVTTIEGGQLPPSTGDALAMLMGSGAPILTEQETRIAATRLSGVRQRPGTYEPVPIEVLGAVIGGAVDLDLGLGKIVAIRAETPLGVFAIWWDRAYGQLVARPLL